MKSAINTPKPSGIQASGEDIENQDERTEKIITPFDKTPICQGEGQECYDALFWGPYLSERQWGTVREDYSADDSCWSQTTYENAVSTAYRSGEDGLLGVSDKHGLLCASLALWNGEDGILKERLFGLSGKEGNHGEDVKELFYHLDNTPDHSYMHALYKYPHAAFPYNQLRHIEATVEDPECKIVDTGIFDTDEYWDIHVEYAKPSYPHLVCKYTAVNKSDQEATLHIIPQFSFRNTWRKPPSSDTEVKKDEVEVLPSFTLGENSSIEAIYDAGEFLITFHHSDDVTFNKFLFTNNDSVGELGDIPNQASISLPHYNHQVNNSNTSQVKDPSSSPCKQKGRPRAKSNRSSASSTGTRTTWNRRSSMFKMNKENKPMMHKKDAFHKQIIRGMELYLRGDKMGTKVGAWMTCVVPPKGQVSVYWQIHPPSVKRKHFNTVKKLDDAIQTQKAKADEFYLKIIPKGLAPNQTTLCRLAIAGLLWSKQFYLYHGEGKVDELYKLYGEDHFYTDEGERKFHWKHMDCEDILLVPDKWEFPWFASWDLAFQSVLYAPLDLEFAKKQIITLLSERYMDPNGQMPGCEFNFSDPNPPIFAWAVLKIHEHEPPKKLDFIKTVYPRLIINYQWWRNMDPSNSHLFGNGFMGLDNISIIDRTELPQGVKSLKQADATGWMGMFALNMLQLTLKQCVYDICQIDMAIRFLSDFLAIAKAINKNTEHGGLWCIEDSFYYDVAEVGKHQSPIRVRSWTGIIPLFACAKISFQHAPAVKTYLRSCSKEFSPYVSKLTEDEFFFTLVPYIKLKSILNRVFDEEEFLSPFGIRSLSKHYKTFPADFEVKGHQKYHLSYLPGESDSDMFGGNSNWRGPIWLCLNYMFVECLEKYSELNQIFTNPLSMDYPAGLPLSQRKPFITIVQDLCTRIISMFTLAKDNSRKINADQDIYKREDWRDLVLFYEYYNADTGKGCGASHQTGWSALCMEFIKKLHNLKTSSGNKK